MGASMLEEHPASVGGIYIHDVFSGDNSTPKSPRVLALPGFTCLFVQREKAALSAHCREL